MDWAHYTDHGYWLAANAQCIKRAWSRPVGAEGLGITEPEKVIHPCVSEDKHGRLDLKIDLIGVAKGKTVY